MKDEPDIPATSSLDHKLAAAIWRWSAGQRGPIDSGHEIASLLEWFLCALHFARVPDGGQRNWWSDGVVYTALEQLDAATFFVVGATIWADADANHFYLGPFEVEFYLSSVPDLDFQRTVVRFGKLDSDGEIIRKPWDSIAAKIIETRPKHNSEWAMAIELS